MPLSRIVFPFRPHHAERFFPIIAHGLALFVLSTFATPALAQTTFTVNNLGDEDDFTHGDGLCDISPTLPDEQCSLRAAIEEANASAGADVIEFTVGGLIQIGANPAPLDVGLPDITETLTIDGTTAPGYGGVPVVQVDGGLLSGSAYDGLRLSSGADFTTVRALSITRFPDNGVAILGASSFGIYGSYIGLETDGTGAGNGDNGVLVDGGDNNAIGSHTETRNVISNNGTGGAGGTRSGVSILNGTGNVVRNNYIGVDPTGALSRGNDVSGVFLGSGATETVIGGPFGWTDPAYRNVISGNGTGIQLSGADENTIQGNYIGTNAIGDGEVRNLTGILLFAAASDNLIGGEGAQEGNLISGNGLGLSGNGIELFGAGTSDNTIQNNYIGTNAEGNAALGNNLSGIYILDGAANTLIGGLGDAGNVISGNSENGIVIEEAATSGTVIVGNSIGVTAADDAVIPNGIHGVLVNGPSAIIVDNLIGGNESGGVVLIGADGSTIASNEIGTNLDGDDLGNAGAGLRVATSNNTIVSNTIGFNLRGIQSEGSDNTIEDNTIGTDALGNDLGNTASGIDLFSSASNNAVQDNVIGFNGGPGIHLREAFGNTPMDNDLGENVYFSNGGLGIDLGDDGRTPNDVGDPDTGPNHLQNAPAVPETSVDAGTGDVTLTYLVDSDPTNTPYPILIRFYRADADHEEGEAIIFSDTYSATDYNGCGTPPCEVTLTFAPAATISSDDYILATATDADDNTSEFSASLGEIAPVAGWRMFAVPGAGLTVAEMALLNLVQGVPGSYPAADPNLYVDYVGPTRTNYTPAPSLSHGLDPGRGFFWYLFDNTDFPGSPPPEFVDIEDVEFPPNIGTEQTVDVSVAFAAIPATAAGDLPAYMLGNPFRAAFQLSGISADEGTLQTNFFAWDPLFASYVTLGTTDYVAPWQGLWAEVDDGSTPPEFTFAVGSVDPTEDPPFIGLTAGDLPPASAGSTTFALALDLRGTLLPAEGPAQAGDGGKAVADISNRIRFEADAQLAWDRHDGSKFYPPLTTEGYALLSLGGIRNGGAFRQSVRSLPSGLTEAVTIPLAFLSGTAGEFTLSAEGVNLPEGWTATLRDLETDAEVDLLTESYSFTGSADEDWQDRFAVTIAPAGASGEGGEPVAFRLSTPSPNPASASTALVLRLPAGKAGVPEAQHVTARVYDALGRLVATAHNETLEAGEEARMEIDTSTLAAGVYVVRVKGETFAETRRFTVVR